MYEYPGDQGPLSPAADAHAYRPQFNCLIIYWLPVSNKSGWQLAKHKINFPLVFIS